MNETYPVVNTEILTSPYVVVEKRTPSLTSEDFLDKAKAVQAERGKVYNNKDAARPERSNRPERSMAQTIEAFNAITGYTLKTSDGWLLMNILKMVRGENSPEFHFDSALDLVSYASLYAESKSQS